MKKRPLRPFGPFWSLPSKTSSSTRIYLLSVCICVYSVDEYEELRRPDFHDASNFETGLRSSSWSPHPQKRKVRRWSPSGFATTLACPGGIAGAVDEPCDSSANLQVLRLASTAGSLHKHISTAPGGFVSNIWIVCKRCRGAVLWRAL